MGRVKLRNWQREQARSLKEAVLPNAGTPAQASITGAQLGTLQNVSGTGGDLPVKLTQWVVGCSVFTYLPWDAKRWTFLEKLDLAMAKHDAGGWLNLPPLRGCALNALPSRQFVPVMGWRGCEWVLRLLSSR